MALIFSEPLVYIYTTIINSSNNRNISLMPISWESNLTYLKLGKNLIPLTKDDNEPAKVYISFRGTTVASKPKYPDRAIRAKEKDGGDFYNSSTTS